MRFLNWTTANVGKNKNKKKKNKHNKGSKKMTYDSNWKQTGEGAWKYTGANNSTYPANSKFNCSHTPSKGCKVGDFTLYPTADKFITRKALEDFDVVCPLTDGGYGVDYNEFCGLIMWIPIKDMTAPDYLRLRVNAQRIVQLMKDGNTIALWCVGSHGRTGLVLATCIGLCEPDVDPIDAVRERHCEHAVETQAQLETVFKALNKPLPSKWKPKPVVVEPRKVPSYVTKGGAWASNETPGYLVTGSKYRVCDYCDKYGSYNDPIHWYGQIAAHTECYNQAVAQADKLKETQDAVDKAAAELAQAGSLPPLLSAKQQHQLAAASETDDPTTPVSNEEFKQLVRANRPINARWSAEQKTKLVGIDNLFDSFGDVICIQCDRLIIDPIQTTHFQTNGISFLCHKDCNAWQKNVMCDVLCQVCYEMPGDIDGYCSTECQMKDAFEKAHNNDVLSNKSQNTETKT